MPPELGRLSIQTGDVVRVSSGTLYRVVDVTLGGALTGANPRINYHYGRPTVDIDQGDIIEWRAGPDRLLSRG